jgi:hypothetical protein
MTIGILQPGYLPWLGFFEQLKRSDIFVIYDDVQYDKNSWRNRNRIKTPQGIQWLSVPVKVKFTERPSIFEVKIDNNLNWQKKHLLSLKQSYSKAPYFNEYFKICEEAFQRNWEYLIDIDLWFIMKISECLGIDTAKIKRSSQLDVSGDRIERLIALCKLFKADIFYEGFSGKEYINELEFAKQGIKVVFQEYNHPEYPQLYGRFIPYLSTLDLLFNCGPKSMEILMGSSEIKP